MPNLKNYIIFSFKTCTTQEEVLAVLAKDVEGKIKCTVNSVFTIISIQSHKCMDEITMHLEQAEWEFMIFNMDESRGTIPQPLKNVFFEFLSAQPFIKAEPETLEEKVKRLRQENLNIFVTDSYKVKHDQKDIPAKDDLQWIAQGGNRTPEERLNVLALRRSTYRKALKEALEYEKFEMASLYRDYITLLTNTMVDIEIEIQVQEITINQIKQNQNK